MPIIKSAKKELRKSRKRYVRNLNVRRKIKKLIKEIKELAKDKKGEEVKKNFLELQKTVDKAAKKNIIHKNKAARIKSRISKQIVKTKKVTKK